MSDAGESSGSACPVLEAWAASQFVLKRLCEKDLLVISGGKLTRGTVVMNQELIMPIINLVGCWALYRCCPCRLHV